MQVFTSDYGRQIEEVLADECQAIHLEVWAAGDPNVEREAVTRNKTVIEFLMGAVGHETLYVPDYMSFVTRHFMALQQNTVQVNETTTETQRTLETLPSDGTVSPQELQRWHNPPDYGCPPLAEREMLGWTVSTCVEGRW